MASGGEGKDEGHEETRTRGLKAKWTVWSGGIERAANDANHSAKGFLIGPKVDRGRDQYGRSEVESAGRLPVCAAGGHG